MRERLPVAVRTGTQQQNLHRPFASQAQSPQQILRPAHVVAHYARLARLYNRAGMLAQVALEAAARKQPCIVAVCRDEHERAGFAISRARGMQENAHHEWIAHGAFTFEQGKKGTE